MLASGDGLSLYRKISRKGRIHLEERGYSTEPVYYGSSCHSNHRGGTRLGTALSSSGKGTDERHADRLGRHSTCTHKHTHISILMQTQCNLQNA